MWDILQDISHLITEVKKMPFWCFVFEQSIEDNVIFYHVPPIDGC